MTDDYTYITSTTSQIVISQYLFTITHVLCFLNKSNELKQLLELNSDWMLRSDILESSILLCNGKKASNLYRCSLRFFKHFIRELWNFTIPIFNLCNKEWFFLLLLNPSKKLTISLNNLVISSEIIHTTIHRRLPIIQFSESSTIGISDFINTGKWLLADSAKIKSFLMPLGFGTGSKKG